jgi:hypothetical protein
LFYILVMDFGSILRADDDPMAAAPAAAASSGSHGQKSLRKTASLTTLEIHVVRNTGAA